MPGPDTRRNGSGDGAALGWLLGFVRPHWRNLAKVLALSVIATGLALIQPYLTKILIDDGLIARNMMVVLVVCGILVVTAALSAILGGINRWLYTTLSGRILFALREDLFRHLERLSPGFFAARGTGDVMARLDGDIAEIQRFSTDSLLAVVNGVLAFAGSVAIMLTLSVPLTLIAFILLPAQVAYLRIMRPRVERLTRLVRERTGDITGFFVETLTSIKFIQSMAAEDREAKRLSGLNEAYLGDLLDLQITNYMTGAVPGILMTMATAVVFVGGGYLLVGGQLSLGTLIAFSVYLARAAAPVQTFLGIYIASQRALVSLARVSELRDETPAVTSPEVAKSLPGDARGHIRFEDVTFAFPDRNGSVLTRAALDIRGGDKIAIVGPSGAGKSTLVDLLHRHYDPDQGRILLDGIDLRDLDLGELRRRVAVVAQDTVLFRGSIAANIRYGRPDAPDQQVEEAASRAQIDAFIGALPEGYNSEIGERGARLSGGQRQRLALARAILLDPLVLILDEATSGIDLATEARLSHEIDGLFAGRTRIVISHRDSATLGADQVYELRDGRLIKRAPQ